MTPSPTPVETSAELFRVLGHETRLRLLMLLAAGEQAVSQIDALSGFGQPGLSQQLAILRKARLVTTRRAAKQVYYRVDPAALQQASLLLARLAGPTTPADPAPSSHSTVPPGRQTGSAARFPRMVN